MKNLNKNYFTFLSPALLFVLLVITNCKKETNTQSCETPLWQSETSVPANPFNYKNPALPSFFYNQFVSVLDNTPSHNQITDWGATLGRVLFYDKRLSKNRTISCGSCHIQAYGFSDTARFSKGLNHQRTPRHSMGLVNARYYASGNFFWDERANSLEEQVLMPIQDEIEMDMSLDSVVLRLKKIDYYPQLFNLAFGSFNIDSIVISKALAQFVRSLVSFNSKYDKGRVTASSSEVDFINFSLSENRGKSIFFNNGILNCSGCHHTDLFLGDNPRNNGMQVTADSGVGSHTGLIRDLYTFKTPSLKNIAIRPPYMHNGIFKSLEQVVNHYSDNIADHAYLDPHFRTSNGGVAQLNLNSQEKRDLINFLNTLTDEVILTDEKFSDPFFK